MSKYKDINFNDITTVEQFGEYIVNRGFDDEFETRQQWYQALESKIPLLMADEPDEYGLFDRIEFYGDEPIRLYRYHETRYQDENGNWCTRDWQQGDPIGIHWQLESDCVHYETPNVCMDFDVHLPYIAFDNGIDCGVEVVIPPSSLAKCNPRPYTP